MWLCKAHVLHGCLVWRYHEHFIPAMCTSTGLWLRSICTCLEDKWYVFQHILRLFSCLSLPCTSQIMYIALHNAFQVCFKFRNHPIHSRHCAFFSLLQSWNTCYQSCLLSVELAETHVIKLTSLTNLSWSLACIHNMNNRPCLLRIIFVWHCALSESTWKLRSS